MERGVKGTETHFEEGIRFMWNPEDIILPSPLTWGQKWAVVIDTPEREEN